VFFNYRRSDFGQRAKRLCDALRYAFGRDQVFKDTDTIGPGSDFVVAIEEALARAELMIAAIGPTWLTVADEQGERRLEDPADDVRRELEIALDRAVPIIPVLVEGAAAPDRDERPESLRGLVAHQAFVLRDEGWFDRVGGPLIESVSHSGSRQPSGYSRWARGGWWVRSDRRSPGPRHRRAAHPDGGFGAHHRARADTPPDDGNWLAGFGATAVVLLLCWFALSSGMALKRRTVRGSRRVADQYFPSWSAWSRWSPQAPPLRSTSGWLTGGPCSAACGARRAVRRLPVRRGMGTAPPAWAPTSASR
jgi:hypothetical protein